MSDEEEFNEWRPRWGYPGEFNPHETGEFTQTPVIKVVVDAKRITSNLSYDWVKHLSHDVVTGVTFR